MKIDPSLQTHVEIVFRLLNQTAAARAFPKEGTLSSKLTKRVPGKDESSSTVDVGPSISKLFATASVDMWLRAVHSFLTSISLTSTSHIWASVVGYYSSHYTVRALAHLLGYFQLYTVKKIVKLRFENGQYICDYMKKKRGDREHKAYWRLVKRNQLFISDQLFTENVRVGNVLSDAAHRERANYIDHLGSFPTFRPLDETEVKDRIERISGIEFSVPPIPDVDKYPDIDTVQIIAYHRLVRYRDLVDNILGGKNRFWSVYRTPTWAQDYMDYQLTEQANLRSQFT